MSQDADETKTELDFRTPNSVDEEESNKKVEESGKKINANVPFNKNFDASNEVPIFDRGLSTLQSLIFSPTEKSSMETVPPPSSSRCFNCGSYNHSLRECTKPRDATAIATAREEQGSQRGNCTIHVRYHQGSNQDTKNFDDLEPGKFALETLEALGLREFEAPPWIGRMRLMGSPPDYLNPGEGRKEEEESGIVFFDDGDMESGREGTEKLKKEREEVEEGELEEGELKDSSREPSDSEPLPLQKQSTTTFSGEREKKKIWIPEEDPSSLYDNGGTFYEGTHHKFSPKGRKNGNDGTYYQETHQNISPEGRKYEMGEDPVVPLEKYSSSNSRNWINGNYFFSKTNQNSSLQKIDYLDARRQEEEGEKEEKEEKERLNKKTVKPESQRLDWEERGRYVYHQNAWVFVENSTNTNTNTMERKQDLPIHNFSPSPNTYNPHVTQQIPSPHTPSLPYPFLTPAPPMVSPYEEESLSWRHMGPSSRPSFSPFPPMQSFPLPPPQDETTRYMGRYSPMLPFRSPPLPSLSPSPLPPPPPPEELHSTTPSPLPSSPPSDELPSTTPSLLPPPLPWLTPSPLPPPLPLLTPSPLPPPPPPEEPDMDLSP